jgi:uncharacterized membrane protein (DUF485 family)
VSDTRQPSPNRNGTPPNGEHAVYSEIATRNDFLELRRRNRAFVFPVTFASMVWYLTYVICSNWARDFMNIKVIGNINVALVFGLLQFVSTFVIAFLYSRYSTKSLDPLANELREEFDERTGR